MKEIRFHATARLELIESARYYEQQQVDLGRRFVDAVETTTNHIQRFPQSCSEVHQGIRRAIVDNFPYGVVYRCDNDTIQIVAVMHLHRGPGYWQDRL